MLYKHTFLSKDEILEAVKEIGMKQKEKNILLKMLDAGIQFTEYQLTEVFPELSKGIGKSYCEAMKYVKIMLLQLEMPFCDNKNETNSMYIAPVDHYPSPQTSKMITDMVMKIASKISGLKMTREGDNIIKYSKI